ncbi:MAG: TetR/AcrR family transcriptional regulator, partial [Gemmatimonadales bacterium]
MPRARLSRETVTQAALDNVDEAGTGGFEALTLASVAARVGVSAPSLYKHIGSLADLRRQVAIASVRELTRVLGAASVGRAGEDAVIALASEVRVFAQRHPGRYAATQRAGDPNEPADAELIAAGGESVAVIASALRSYDFTPDQTVDAVRAFRSAVHGFVLLELEGGFGLPRHLDASFDVLVRMLARGLQELT